MPSFITPPLPITPRRPRPRTTPTATLPPPLSKLANTLHALPSSRARYLHLVELGAQLPPLSSPSSSTRVPGCTSVTHVEAIVDNGRVRLRGSSDALVARGMAAVVALGLQNARKEAVLAVGPDELIHACGMDSEIRSARLTNIGNILRHVQQQLQQQPVESAPGSDEDVAVLVSGGVDSSVALKLARDSGARVRAYYLKIWLEDELEHLGQCPWEEDLEYVRRTCEMLGVDLEEVSLQKEYWDRVVRYVVREAKEGRTPNPDVMCNSRVKFGAFLERFRVGRVVTGHYARSGGGLWVSRDAVKDQTYFLAGVSGGVLERVWFPLGGFTKSQVRHMARRWRLPAGERRESQGLCFLGKIRFDEFLRGYLGEWEGELVDFDTGVGVGVHRGYWFFTIGQRRGVGLSGGPWYVVAKDVRRNVVYVSRDVRGLGSARFDFDHASWLVPQWQGGPARVKTRHGPNFHAAHVHKQGSRGSVVLAQRDRGLAPGQFAVFYSDAGQCLGCAVISDTHILSKASLHHHASHLNLQAHTS